MLRIGRRIETGSASSVLALPYDDRKKSRLRANTLEGHEVAIMLERGSVLRDGELLAADSGEVLLVRAAPESVSDATAADPVLLARAAYHLGNRHVPLQIGLQTLRYQHDHVLDDMLRALGLEVTVRMASFEPEAGAYAGGRHAHGRDEGADASNSAPHEHNHLPHHHEHDHAPHAKPLADGSHEPSANAKP